MSDGEVALDRAHPGQAPRSRSPRLVDVLLGAAVTLSVSFVITADVTGSGPDARAYVWALGLGALMLVRRRYPVLVVVLSVAGLIAYYSAELPPIGVAVPVAAAVFSAAELGRLLVAMLGSVVVLAVSTTYRLLVGQDPSFVLYELAGHVLLLAAAVALGDSLRSRRQAQQRAAEVAELLAERFRRNTEARLTAERAAISRDLHDSLGHANAVIGLHAQVALEAVGHDDAAARNALDVISSTSAAMMAELRRTVAVLRSREDPHRDRREDRREDRRLMTDQRDLDAAVGPARQAGIDVAIDIALDDTRSSEPLPVAVETAAYLIIKEAVVNVTRHSGAARVVIQVRVVDDTLHVLVADDGRPTISASDRAAPAPPGHGIIGMRERAETLGGTLTAGRTPDGFEVHARLPLVPPS